MPSSLRMEKEQPWCGVSCSNVTMRCSLCPKLLVLLFCEKKNLFVPALASERFLCCRLCEYVACCVHFSCCNTRCWWRRRWTVCAARCRRSSVCCCCWVFTSTSSPYLECYSFQWGQLNLVKFTWWQLFHCRVWCVVVEKRLKHFPTKLLSVSEIYAWEERYRYKPGQGSATGTKNNFQVSVNSLYWGELCLE